MEILQTPTFKRYVKKLHKNQKRDLDKAIKEIADNPYVGEIKKGDLDGVRVYKFKMIKQLTLIAYEFHANQLQLIMLTMGTHENFYRNLKK